MLLKKLEFVFFLVVGLFYIWHFFRSSKKHNVKLAMVNLVMIIFIIAISMAMMNLPDDLFGYVAIVNTFIVTITVAVGEIVKWAIRYSDRVMHKTTTPKCNCGNCNCGKDKH